MKEKIKESISFAGDVVVAGAISTATESAKKALEGFGEQYGVSEHRLFRLVVRVGPAIACWCAAKWLPVPGLSDDKRRILIAAARSSTVVELGAVLGKSISTMIAPIATAFGLAAKQIALDPASTEDDEPERKKKPRPA